MKKIPMLFTLVFDDKGNRVITNEMNPKARTALTSGNTVVATRKVDGTAAMFDGTAWFTRRAVKPGKAAPEGFLALETDLNTGMTFGWEPAESGSFHKMIRKAVASLNTVPEAGSTWELVAPKINGNPENVAEPTLLAHGGAGVDNLLDGLPTIDTILAADDLIGLLSEHFDVLLTKGVEGIVWWVDGTPAVKLRVKDFHPELDSRFRK